VRRVTLGVVTTMKSGEIEVWRPRDLAGLELRRGFAVTDSVPRHWHDEYQFVLGEAGLGTLAYRGSDLLTPPASFFMVHPGEVHANRSLDDSGCSYRTMFVDADVMRRAASEIYGKHHGLPFFPTAVVFDRSVLAGFRRLHAALERPAGLLEREARLLEFLADLIARFAEIRPAPRAVGSERKAILRARDFLVEHHAENVSLETLARVAGLSPFHFHRVFSEQFGMPPHAFQTQIRVSRVKALLRSGSPIPRAAAEAGFADQSHLNRLFKRLVGVTPGRYRAASKIVQDASPSP
jgi:AraC-like DNA-binding protein